MASRTITTTGSRSGFSVPLLIRTRFFACVARDETVRISGSTTAAGTSRFLSAAPATAKQQQQNHLLEWRIQNFLQQHQTERQTRDLGKSMQVLQNQLKEASHCVQDCQECTTQQELQTEIEAAENSVNVAVACLVDLLDELRISETEVATDEIVQRIKKLRMDLGELKKQQQLHLDGKGSE